MTGQLKSSKKHIFRVKRPSTGENGEVTYTTILEESEYESATLKRFKDVVSEVDHGLECGFSLEGYEDFQPNDIIECCRVEMVYKSLVVESQTRDINNFSADKKNSTSSTNTTATTTTSTTTTAAPTTGKKTPNSNSGINITQQQQPTSTSSKKSK